MNNLTTSGDPVLTKGVYNAVEVLLGLLACTGNTLVCWVFCRTPRLWVPTYFFVMSQAVADAGVGCLAVPFSITVGLRVPLNWHVCRFLVVFILLLTQTSVFSLLAIAVDRTLYIRVPLRYPSLMSGRRVKIIILALWIFSFLVILLPYTLWPDHPWPCEGSENATLWSRVQLGSSSSQAQLRSRNISGTLPSREEGRRGGQNGWRNVSRQKEGFRGTKGCPDLVKTCVFEDVMSLSFMVYWNFLVCVLQPLLLMLWLYSRIFCVAQGQLRRLSQPQGGAQAPSPSTLSQEIRVAHSLAQVVLVFCVCWLPMHIHNCIIVFCHSCNHPPPWFTLWAVTLSHANSVVNPLLYAFKLQDFRQAIKTLWQQRAMARLSVRRPLSNTNATLTTFPREVPE